MKSPRSSHEKSITISFPLPHLSTFCLFQSSIQQYLDSFTYLVPYLSHSFWLTMTTPNWYCLRRDVYEGEIDGITLVWGDSSKRRIKENARNLDVTLETVKAVTEHFIFLCAQRLHRGKAVILYVAQ